MTYREEQQLRKAMEILVSLYFGNHETYTTHTTDPVECDRTETKYPTHTTDPVECDRTETKYPTETTTCTG